MLRTAVALLVLWVAAAVPLVPATATGPWRTEASARAYLAGDYEVHGENPNGDGTYAGTVSVWPYGDTYIVQCTIGPQVFIGTGIVAGEWLAVGYDGGTAVYRIGKDGVLDGIWAISGGDALGSEMWTPISTR
jgi:hypothetical protein